jgi:hypothetical protein
MSDFATAKGIFPLPPNHDAGLTVALSVVGGKMMDQLWRPVSTHIVEQRPLPPPACLNQICMLGKFCGRNIDSLDLVDGTLLSCGVSHFVLFCDLSVCFANLSFTTARLF